MSIKSVKSSSLENSIADSQVKKFQVEYLIIAGGGGGGDTNANNYGSGGGGAGGYRSSHSGDSGSGGGAAIEPPIEIKTGVDYEVTVGAGGSGNGWGNDSYFGPIFL